MNAITPPGVRAVCQTERGEQSDKRKEIAAGVREIETIFVNSNPHKKDDPIT